MRREALLIVGGSGFLGAWMARKYHELGFQLLGISTQPPLEPSLWYRFLPATADSQTDYRDLTEGSTVTACFFLAGGSSVAMSVSDPSKDLCLLLPGLSRLVQFLSHNHPECHLLLFSSAAVYGNPASFPVNEGSATTPLSPYGVHKLLAEQLLEHSSRLYNLKTSSLRIFSAFGRGLRRQLFWDVLQKSRAVLQAGGTEITMAGTGDETRDFIHAQDVSEAALLISRRSTSSLYEVFNVANGDEVKVSQAVDKLLRQAGLSVEVKFSGEVRPGEPRNWQASIEKLKVLQYSSSVSFEQGLLDYARWYTDFVESVNLRK